MIKTYQTYNKSSKKWFEKLESAWAYKDKQWKEHNNHLTIWCDETKQRTKEINDSSKENKRKSNI